VFRCFITQSRWKPSLGTFPWVMAYESFAGKPQDPCFDDALPACDGRTIDRRTRRQWLSRDIAYSWARQKPLLPDTFPGLKNPQTALAAGAQPRPHWGSLQRTPRRLSKDASRFAHAGKRKEGKGMAGQRRKEREGKGGGEKGGEETDRRLVYLFISLNSVLWSCLFSRSFKFIEIGTNRNPVGLYDFLWSSIVTMCLSSVVSHM